MRLAFEIFGGLIGILGAIWFIVCVVDDKDTTEKKVSAITALVGGLIFVFAMPNYEIEESTPPVKSSYTDSTSKSKNKSNDDIAYQLNPKDDIEKYTGHYVTDYYVMKENRVKAQNGNITIDSDVEFDNNSDTKTHFWAVYAKDGTLLRLKIGPNIIYDANDKK